MFASLGIPDQVQVLQNHTEFTDSQTAGVLRAEVPEHCEEPVEALPVFVFDLFVFF